MSNILKVTTPMTGYDNTNQLKPGSVKTPDPRVEAPITPEKVVKPDQRSDSASQEQNVALKYKFPSNYDEFMLALTKLPEMTEDFSKLFFEQFQTMVQSGLSGDFAEQISEFFELCSVDEFQLEGFLKEQQSAGVKFTGPFFELLHSVLKDSSSVELKASILEFLRRYVDMSENEHIMNNMQYSLDKISKYMLKSSRDELTALRSLLTLMQNTDSTQNANSKTTQNTLNPEEIKTAQDLKDGIIKDNATILKDKILPHLNRYITKFNDRGDVRETSAKLAALMARYQNGTGERVKESFENLMKFSAMQKAFSDLDPAFILSVLENSEHEKARETQQWTKNFLELLEVGMSGQAGAESKAVFKNLLQSILINESVYMPVMHMMLPLNIDGKLMFSEMWIDPNAGGKNAEGDSERAISGLVKFDIQDMGFFDLYFMYKEGDMSLQLSCPDSLKDDINEIKTGISKILLQNGMSISEMYVETGMPSIPLSAAFPQIFERKNSINVSI